MDNSNFARVRIIISNLITRIPYIYLKNIYETNLLNNNLNYNGNENVVNHINKLFFSKNKINIPIINFGKNNVSNKSLSKFRQLLVNNIDNLCFRANIGSYTDQLEKELRINKKDILSFKNEKNLYKCFSDLYNYNQIRDSLIKKINVCNIYTKYKGKGNKSLIKNHRFLFSHSLSFKILDKLLILDIIQRMNRNNSFPDKNIFINNISHGYNTSIKENAYKILQTKNIVLLDISKAYPSVDHICLIELLYKSLCKRFSKSFSSSFLNKYLFLLKNRYFIFEGKKVNINNGISTGLASSSLIFTFLMESIIDEYIKILNLYGVKFNIDYKLKVFIDDITIIVKNTRYTKIIISSLLKILKYYNFNINENKCRISEGLNYNFTKIKSGDYYLGLPFSDSVKNYLDIILNEFKSRHMNISYRDIKTIIKFSGLPYQNELMNKINGFFQYKLYGLKKYGFNGNLDDLNLLIKEYY